MITEENYKNCPKKVLFCRIRVLERILTKHDDRVDSLESALYWAKVDYQNRVALLIQDYEMQIAKLKKGGAK